MVAAVSDRPSGVVKTVVHFTRLQSKRIAIPPRGALPRAKSLIHCHVRVSRGDKRDGYGGRRTRGFAATYRIGCDMSQRITFIRHEGERLIAATFSWMQYDLTGFGSRY